MADTLQKWLNCIDCANAASDKTANRFLDVDYLEATRSMLCELALVLLRTQAWDALLSAGGQPLVLRAQAWNAHLWLRRLREVFA